MIKDYKNIFSPKFHLTVIALVVFQFFLWNAFLSSWEFFGSNLMFELMIIGIPLTTELYRRYSQEFFLKTNQLVSKSKKEIQLMLFTIVFIDMLIVVFYHFIINYLFQDVFNLVTGNVAGILYYVNYSALMSKETFFIFFTFVLFTIISIIVTTYFLNHFIKNKMFIYGLLIAAIVLDIAFGPVFNWHVFDRIIVDDVAYITTGKYYGPVFTKISLILIPWNSFTYMFNWIVRRADWVTDIPFLNFWDSTYIESGLKFINWYPYIMMILFIIIPRISRESFKKKSKNN